MNGLIEKWVEAKEMTKMEKWEREIEWRHPIIAIWPRQEWSRTARFFGWLPLPPM